MQDPENAYLDQISDLEAHLEVAQREIRELQTQVSELEYQNSQLVSALEDIQQTAGRAL